MRYMNDWDIDRALARYNGSNTPNRGRVALTVANLADWADDNSDGWAYWPKPARAAARAMELLEGNYTHETMVRLGTVDATDAEVTAALRPIKAFLTRHGVDHAEVIPEPRCINCGAELRTPRDADGECFGHPDAEPGWPRFHTL